MDHGRKMARMFGSWESIAVMKSEFGFWELDIAAVMLLMICRILGRLFTSLVRMAVMLKFEHWGLFVEFEGREARGGARVGFVAWA